ncbi:MAG: DUF4405 domain-containing protein [Phycisphaeraceae bacterium JB051]
MSSIRWRLLIDLVSFLAGCALLWTGAVLWWILPHGSRSSNIWGWTRHDLGEIHEWAGVVLLVSVVIHVFINWQWLMGMVHKLFKAAQTPTRRRRLIWGIACFVLFFGLMGGSLFVANQQKQIIPGGRGQHRLDRTEIQTPQTFSFHLTARHDR